MSSLYDEYLKDRLEKGEATCSLPEKAAIYAIDKHSASGNFVLLYLQAASFDLFLCRTDKSSSDEKTLFSITEMRSGDHGLGEIYNELCKSYKSSAKQRDLAFVPKDGTIFYDPYYDKFSELKQYNEDLSKALDRIPPEYRSKNIYIFGEYSEYKAVLHAVKGNQKNGIKHMERSSIDQSTPKNRAIPPKAMDKTLLNTMPGLSLSSCTNTKGVSIWLPLQSNTLDSEFVKGGESWRTVVPNCDQTDCKIAGIECKYVNVRSEFDAFGNVFYKVTDAHGQSKYTHIIKSAIQTK